LTIPNDAEVARWLDFDKLYVRRQQMRAHRLRASDLVGAVTLVEPLDGSSRARVLHGPARYSSYNINTFLFTAGGVRQSRVALDFASGVFSAESRMFFHYNSVTWVCLMDGAEGTGGFQSP